MVSIFLPSSLETFCKQEFKALPSIITVHAPHSPFLHPSFVPVKFKSSRRKRNKVRSGWTSLSIHLPLTMSFTFCLIFLFISPPLDSSASHFLCFTPFTSSLKATHTHSLIP